MSTPPLYLSRIRGNLGLGVDATLGPRTLVVGENRSGKTSLVSAAEVLLTGGCGKAGKLPAALAGLATCGSAGLELHGELSSGLGATFKVNGSIDKASRPVWYIGSDPPERTAVTTPLGACLSGAVTAALAGDPARTLRPELLRLACGTLDPAKLVEFVPLVFHAEWQALWTRVRAACASDADTLAAVAEELRAQARGAKKASQTQVQGSADRVPEDVGPVPTDAEIESLRQQLSGARAAASVGQQRERLASELATAKAQLRALSDTGNGNGTELVLLVLPALDGAEKVLVLLQAAHEQGRRPLTCPCCEQEISPAALPGLRQRAGERTARARYTFAQAAEQAALRERIAQLEAWQADEARAGNAQDAGETPESIEARLLDALRRQEHARVQSEAVRARAAACNSADALQALSAACDRMMQVALTDALAGFEQRVNARLGDGKLRFRLFDPSGKAICKVQWEGTVHGRGVQVPLQGLSGAQRADVTAAFACAWAARETAPVTLLVIDEVFLDHTSLPAMLKALGETRDRIPPDSGPSQVIVCVGTDWGQLVPAGWTRVQL